MYLCLRAQAAHTTASKESVIDAVFDANGGTFGRDPHCQMVLPDPMRRISRIQGQVLWEHGSFHLLNASTSNPIYIDMRELKPGEKSTITSGEEWRTGNYAILVEVPANCDTAPAFAQARSHDGNVHPAPPEPLANGSLDDLIGPESIPCGPATAEAEMSTAHDCSVAASDCSMNPFSSPVTQKREFTSISTSAGMDTPIPLLNVGSDPFADLLGPPVHAQMDWNTSESSPHPPSGSPAPLIPSDFNLLAATYATDRNSHDPLQRIEQASSLKDMFPEKSVDTIFTPAEGSLESMMDDSLQVSQHRKFLDVSAQLDPLALFSTMQSGDAANSDLLFTETHVKETTRSDHRPELGSYFRAPRPIAPEAPQGTDIPSVPPLVDSEEMVEQAPTGHSAPGVGETTHQTPPQWQNHAWQTDTNIGSAPSDSNGRAINIDEFFPLDGDPDFTQDPANGSPLQPFNDAAPTEYSEQEMLDPHSSSMHAPDCSRSTSLPSMQEGKHLHAADASPDLSVDAALLLDAFKQGAGLSDCRYPQQLTPQLLFDIGQMLHESIQGSMDLLNSRAVAKQEVRIAVTLINAEANNPLKFLPTSAAALAQIFGPKMPGFMNGPAAISNAHDDLRRHEMAMMAGMQAVLQGLFDRFNPDTIETQLEAHGRHRSLFNVQRQAKLWNIYRHQYQWLRNEMKNQSPASWGSEFHGAYQSETENLNLASLGVGT